MLLIGLIYDETKSPYVSGQPLWRSSLIICKIPGNTQKIALLVIRIESIAFDDEPFTGRVIIYTRHEVMLFWLIIWRCFYQTIIVKFADNPNPCYFLIAR